MQVAFVVDDVLDEEEVLEAVELELRLSQAGAAVIVPLGDGVFDFADPVDVAQNLQADDVEWRRVLLVPIVQSEVSQVLRQTQKLRQHALDGLRINEPIEIQKAKGNLYEVAWIYLNLVLC